MLVGLIVCLFPMVGSMTAYADTVIDVETDKSKEITLYQEDKRIESKVITGSGNFVLSDDKDVGKYKYKLTDGKTDYTIEQYIVYENDIKKSFYVSYAGLDKFDKIIFTDAPVTKTEPAKTGDASPLPWLIPVCAGAGAGIGVAVYFLTRKKR